ncbi:ribonuclease [Lactobacillus sp. CBA3606]|uniref:ribonuclease H family protein n=1 Tax=Lactobacillus sp. CBA3606 TaxID=2099789 RepID=UPI000CFB2F93|nr:ribonuclease H family protein [Lactobacillus sp. CBA3606]AVK62765.1 ribonuclease [Lactobacillus sp. CBA3606]
MAKKQFYAVRAGYKTGIYQTWAACQQQINGYSGAQYKGFMTRTEAEAYLHGQARPTKSGQTVRTSPKVSAAKESEITVYTDGGNRNTGNVQGGQVRSTDKSAWAYQIQTADEQLTGTGGEWGATNNRMEIMALLQALDRLTKLNKTTATILVIMDSKYVLDAIQKGWLTSWRQHGWRRAKGELINAELWQALYQQLQPFKHLDFKWVKGHANTSGNNAVDQLLNTTMDQMKAGQPIPVQNATAKLAPTRPLTMSRGIYLQRRPHKQRLSRQRHRCQLMTNKNNSQ